AVSVAHACLAQTFFCLVVAIAVVTSPRWDPQPASARRAPTLLAALAAGAVFVQLVVGAVMRHTKAGLAIPDFPLSLGRVVPRLDSCRVACASPSRAWSLAAAAAVLAAVVAAHRAGLRRS